MDTENTNDPAAELDTEGNGYRFRSEDAGAEDEGAEGHGRGRIKTRIDEAGDETDAEGHVGKKNVRIGEAGDDDDVEGHRGKKSVRIGEAGDDDVEGHRLPKR